MKESLRTMEKVLAAIEEIKTMPSIGFNEARLLQIAAETDLQHTVVYALVTGLESHITLANGEVLDVPERGLNI